ncbi:hypothetical protein [Dactylosporangium sp. NPDC051484]|uniref:hypothetical protein n=1 Tax=Dactylosporangium sp. NPDC051484 TaxID=3154942 RepID=UPI00344E9C0F
MAHKPTREQHGIDAAVLTRLVTDPGLVVAAADAREEMAASPAPETPVPWLESRPPL